MICCKSEQFRSSAKFLSGLIINTKEDLKEIAFLLGVSIPTKLRKNEFAESLADAILSDPDIWLPQLTRYELTILQKLVNAGPNTYIESSYVSMTTALESLTLVISDYDYVKEGKIRYMICDELRESIAPHVDNLLNSQELKTHHLIEQYMLGIINLYGLLPLAEMIKLLKEYLKDSEISGQISHTLDNSILLRQYTFKMVDQFSSTPYVRSPFLSDIEKLDREIYEHPEAAYFRKFTAEEVFEAGSLPFVSVGNPCLEKLKNFMKSKQGLAENEIVPILHHLWYESQIKDNEISIIFPFIDTLALSINEVQEAIGIYSDYINHCPRWFLKGYSPAEASVLLNKYRAANTPPRLVAGANMKAAGMDIAPDLQARLGELYRETFSGQRVGRNDPCPCGSGKKYKKCCGRDN